MRRAAAVVLGAIAIAIILIATVDPLGLSDGAAPSSPADADARGQALVGPDVPPPSTLPGSLLVVTAEGCRPAVVGLEEPSLGPLGPTTHCRLSASRHGQLAVVHGLPDQAGVESFSLLELSGRPAVADELGRGRGRVAWSLDGQVAAWCDHTGVTRVRAVGTDEETLVPGCDPRVDAAGRILTRDLDEDSAAAVRVDGSPSIQRAAVQAALPEEGAHLVRVIGWDANDAGTVALLVLMQGARDLKQIVQLWRGSVLEAWFQVATRQREFAGLAGDFGLAGRTVRLSPTGREVAIGSLRPGTRISVFDVETGQRALLPAQHAIDWSPDGQWIAVAAPEEILIVGTERSSHVFRLPIAARALVWTEA